MNYLNCFPEVQNNLCQYQIVKIENKNKSILVDKDVYEKIKSAKVYFYFVRTSPTIRIVYEDGTLINFNKLLFDYDQTRYVLEYKNGNFFDKRRSNINLINKGMSFRKLDTSLFRDNLYKGVSYCKYSNRYRSYICINKKTLTLGYHHNPEEAALLYDTIIYNIFGNNVFLNFPDRLKKRLPKGFKEKLRGYL